MAVRQREVITSPDLTDIDGFAPLAGVRALSGVRVHDVGQGDAVAVLDENGLPVVQIDYGGREGHPFVEPDWADSVVPAEHLSLVMMTHWDEDHWCAARKAEPIRDIQWLVPRQITSPRAVQFSLKLEHASCIPDTHVGRAFCFRAENGDELWWEKIAHGPAPGALDEDCNRTGVAVSVVRRDVAGGGSVILLPGDAPFHRISHYWQHFQNGLVLLGVVAFHHGAGTHWTEATERLLVDWSSRSDPPAIIFSCANPNAYGHPDDERYANLLPFASFEHTSDLRSSGNFSYDLLFQP